MKLRTTVTSQTLLGGFDNPNCFSLAGAEGGSFRVVNMRLGPFERVRARLLLDRRVEGELICDGHVILTDSRIPVHELTNDRWCTVCTPFKYLPESQQRAYLATHTPVIRDGQLVCWSMAMPVVAVDVATVESRLAQLREIGYLQCAG